MRILAIITALIVFELALIAVSPAIGENENALDLPQYKSDSEYVTAVELNEENISDDQSIPQIKTNMSPAYIVAATGQLSNSCSGTFEKATESFNAKRYNEAISFLNETIKICPNYANAWYNRGYIEFQLTHYNEALDDFCMATELNPTDADYWAFKGIVLSKQKNYEEALSAFNISININPDLSYARDWKDSVLESLVKEKSMS
jgi:tetratricopeptide (TPR) repeat protein